MRVHEADCAPVGVPDGLDHLLALFEQARDEAAACAHADDPAAPYRALLAAIKGAEQPAAAPRGPD